MIQERRINHRVPVELYVHQVVGDELFPCFTTDLSSSGLFLERPTSALSRDHSLVQLEVPLPGEGDTLWACGRVVYDWFDHASHGSAVEFVRMAGKHRRWLREWLHEKRVQRAVGREVPIVNQGVRILRPPIIIA